MAPPDTPRAGSSPIHDERIARPTAAVVDLGACARNYHRIRDHTGRRHIWAVVKADAYGHGAVPVARCLAAEGCQGFAVASVQEGVELRRAGVAPAILITAGIEPLTATCSGLPAADGGAAGVARDWIVRLVAEHDLAVAIWDAETAAAVARVVGEQGLAPVRAHLKVDTGMGRLGVMPEDSVACAAMLHNTPGIELEGVFSNLAAADHGTDEAGYEHTALQITRFAEVCAALDADGLLPPHRHLANTAALMHHPHSWEAEWCNGVMPGLSLYGASLTPDREPLGLEPALSWWTAVAAVHDVPAGWPVGYGLRHVADRPSRIAVLPVGYHDGWPRALSGRARVLVAGRRAAVVGAVSMDLTMVDVTDLAATRVGDPVALIGSWGDESMGVFLCDVMGCVNGALDSTATPVGARFGGVADSRPDDRITAEDLAEWGDSIAHEVLCRLGGRVPRLYSASAADPPGRHGDVSEGGRSGE